MINWMFQHFVISLAVFGLLLVGGFFVFRRSRTSSTRSWFAGREIQLKALLQLFVIWFFSNLPIGMAVLFEKFTLDPTTFSWTASLSHNLNAGEVYIYCAALVAPFVWTLGQYFHQQRRLPFWWIPGSLAFFSTFLGAVVFAIARLSGKFNTELVTNTGFVLYATSLIVWYWSLVADLKLSEPEPPYKLERRAVKDLVAKLEGDGHE